MTNKLTKKEVEEQLDAVNHLVEHFKRCGISAIIKIPDFGTLSLFDNEQDRITLLDHAKTEIRTQELLNERIATEWANKRITEAQERFNLTNKDGKKKSYIN